MARLLMDPATCVKPREEWPLRLQRTRVFVQPGEWAKILRGLYGRGMIKFLQASELITHNGRPLLNGLFGVPKGNIFEDGFDLDSCILRLICNCIPTNELQDVVEGEIRGLPQFSQWALLEMLEREFFLVSGDDQTAAFFLYLLEKAWWPWFVLGREAPEELLTELGLPVNAPWPALCVIAMGWCSATGIVQHLHMQLVRSCRERLKTGEGLAELSKAAVMSVTRYMRSLGFLEVYLDDTLYAELCSDERFVKELHTIPPMQEVLREVYSEWGIATSSKKAFHRLPEALARGGKLDGVAGRGDPSPDKLDKVICMCWDLLGTAWARWQQLAALGGQACFLFQFRRAGFTVLFHYWEVMHSPLGAREASVGCCRRRNCWACCLCCPWSTSTSEQACRRWCRAQMRRSRAAASVWPEHFPLSGARPRCAACGHWPTSSAGAWGSGSRSPGSAAPGAPLNCWESTPRSTWPSSRTRRPVVCWPPSGRTSSSCRMSRASHSGMRTASRLEHQRWRSYSMQQAALARGSVRGIPSVMWGGPRARSSTWR
jgi:hypothetical protein